MNKLIPISVVALVALEGHARADQCAWVAPDVAARARDILAKAPTVLSFCEPCGDAVPGIPTAPATVELREPSHDFRELAIGGRNIDLAYTFAQTSTSEYKNVALLAGCPATGVSPTLHLAPETKDGVLITAEPARAAPTSVATPPASAPMEPAPVAPSPAVYTYTTTRYELPWSVLVLAAAGGFAFGALAALLLVATRRRHALRPRATDLR